MILSQFGKLGFRRLVGSVGSFSVWDIIFKNVGRVRMEWAVSSLLAGTAR